MDRFLTAKIEFCKPDPATGTLAFEKILTVDVDVHPDDIVIYNAEGYEPLKQFLAANMVLNLSVVVRVFFRPQLPPSRMKGVEGEKKCWGWPVL
jgi:hypothetical protein